MSWCPNCKKEYDKEFTICESCQSELIQNPGTYEYEAVAYVEKEIAQRLIKLLHFSGIPDATMVYDPFNQNYEIQVDRSNYKKAADLVRIFKENEFDANYTEDSEFGSDEDYVEIEVPAVSAYTKTAERYKDNFSSGVTFLLCGFLGLLFLILENFGVIQLINSTGISKILSNVVIGGLFIAFIIIGVYSLRYSKELKKQSSDEELFTEKLLKWLRSSLKYETIESTYESGLPEELKYFKRIEVIKAFLEKGYSSLDEEYLLQIADDYYAELFN